MTAWCAAPTTAWTARGRPDHSAHRPAAVIDVERGFDQEEIVQQNLGTGGSVGPQSMPVPRTGRTLASVHNRTTPRRGPSGHPKGRSEAEDPRSGLTRWTPSRHPATRAGGTRRVRNGASQAPELPAGDEGAQPPASPNVLHWVGWLFACNGLRPRLTSQVSHGSSTPRSPVALSV